MIKESGRIHGFDALRGIAMLLGIVLHAIIPYTIHPVAGWPNDTALSSSILEALYHFIHSFRMELFFFVAGYFANLSLTKNGVSSFIQNRKKRVLIPFIAAILLLLPFCYIAFKYYAVYSQQPALPSVDILKIAVQQSLRWNGLVHLWFLYYLLAFYGLLLLLRKFIPESLSSYFSIAKGKAVVTMVLLISILLAIMPALPVQVSTSLFPPISLLAYYFLFFMWGYLNYGQPLKPAENKTYAVVLIFIAIAAQAVFYFNLPQLSERMSAVGSNWLLYPLLCSIGTVCLVAGAILGFLAVFHKGNTAFTYLADASYWMYLIHVPIVVAMHVALLSVANSAENSWIKPILVMGITILVTLLSYQYLVRYTRIGEYLHGKRNRP